MNLISKHITFGLLGMCTLSYPMALPLRSLAPAPIIVINPAPAPQPATQSLLSQTAELASYVLPWKHKKSALGYSLVAVGTCVYQYWNDQRFKRIVNRGIAKVITTLGSQITQVRNYIQDRFNRVEDTQNHHTEQIAEIRKGQQKTHNQLAVITALLQHKSEQEFTHQ